MLRAGGRQPSHSLRVRVCIDAYNRHPPTFDSEEVETISDADGSWVVAREMGILKFVGRKPLKFSPTAPLAEPFFVPLRSEKRILNHRKKYPLHTYIPKDDDDELIASPYWLCDHYSAFGISPERVNEYYIVTDRLLEPRTGNFGFGVQNCSVGRVRFFYF